jgi:hypothetical protein
MEVDHLFVFTGQPVAAAELLQAFGLTEGSPNVHPSQGTSCRRFFFENAYLELVWISNEADIKSPAVQRTQFWERSQYKDTNFSPFGICFRQPHTKEFLLLFEESWHYTPPYLSANHYANIADNQHFLSEPMLFEMPFFGLKPADYPQEKKQPLVHQKGFCKLTKVILTMPAFESISVAFKKVLAESIVEMVPGNSYQATLEFDNGIKGETADFGDILPLSFCW